ncbi:MAG: GntR family transcriptional regulator [Gordonia sp. (in: high G+C Gram-positive bacteria)]
MTESARTYFSLPRRTDVGEHPRARTGSARGRQTSARRVRDLISLSIRMGYFTTDQPLVEHELVEVFNTSRTSVRAALAQLRDEGVIDRRPRAGTRVRRPGITIPLSDFCTLDKNVTIELVEERVVPAFPLVREQLGITEEFVRMVENLFVHEGVAIGVRTAYFSAAAVRSVEPEEQQVLRSMADVVTTGFGVEPGGVDVLIGCERAGAHDARLLGVEVDAPLTVREMIYYDVSSNPIQMVFDRFRSDHVRFEGSTGFVRPADLG